MLKETDGKFELWIKWLTKTINPFFISENTELYATGKLEVFAAIIRKGAPK